VTDVAAMLNQVSDTLAKAATSPEDAARLITRAAATVLDSTCVLWLAEEGTEELMVAASSGPVASPSSPVIEPGLGDGLRDAVGRALESGEPFTVSAPTCHEVGGSGSDSAPASGAAPEQSVLTAIAIRLCNGTAGALGVVRPAPCDELGDLELALLRQLGDRAALTLDCLDLQAAVARERSRRRQVEGDIRAQAASDPLTGLPNRFLLADHSAGGATPPGAFPPLSGADRTVLVLDIDRFQEINDTLGHAIGDVVLLEISRRLGRFGEPVELVARLGSDEFALVARRAGSPEADEQLAAQLLSVLGEPFDVGGAKLRLRASIGIAPGDVDDAGNPLAVPVLLGRAESAMYQAKREHARVRRYSDNLERTSLLRLTLAGELAEAIDHDQLQLDYQPKVATLSGQVTGVEALVRWMHPTRGLLAPDVFVPLAEQTGVIGELTNWVLDRALAECASWRRAGFLMPVAVNLSGGTVQDASLPDTVMAALGRAGLPSEAIELEITESAVMRDPVGALRTLEVLAAEGVLSALDDFGTGYSSLGYLQRLPFASVKIDKSFVSPLAEPDNSVAHAIVTAVIELGHSLGLEVIAEGVDSPEVLEAVTTMGCDAVQGYQLAVPMNGAHLREWIGSRSPLSPLPEATDPTALLR
jgi:diguanylate cyclase (GGDEF)-like protein